MQELISIISNGNHHIRQDSCRVCGNEVKAIHFCQVCNQPIQFQCPDCVQYLDEQIHSDCKNSVVSAQMI